MDDIDNFAKKFGLNVIRDPLCPPDCVYLINKKILDELKKEIAKESNRGF